MNADEKALLDQLFERVKAAGTAPRNRDAELYIDAAVKEQPHAPYVLAQAVILQEQALKAADARLHELESKLAEAEKQKATETSFLGGLGASLMGSTKSASGVPVTGAAPQAQPRQNVWGSQAGQAPMPGYAPQPSYSAPPGGSFLSNALTTAAGVAGGALLFEGISSLFRGGGYGTPWGNVGLNNTPVINETIYETVNVQEQMPDASSSNQDWSSVQDAGFDDPGFGGGDSGGDDWA